MPEGSLRSLSSNYWLRAAVVLVLVMLALFLLVLTLSSIKSYALIGTGVPASNTINVSGEGDVFAIPDTATFTVTVDESAADVQTAQTSATKKANDIITYLKQQGIADTDVQTTDYSVNPKYDYQQSSCPASSGGAVVYCPPGKQVLDGYEVSQTLTVKVRDTQKAGTILAGVGSLGASNVSGLSFTVADQNLIEQQARDKAIADARQKADELAKSLGVHIVRVVGFNENNNYPVYFAKASAGVAMDSAAAAPAPQLPVGQNKITSDVSVTYEIR